MFCMSSHSVSSYVLHCVPIEGNTIEKQPEVLFALTVNNTLEKANLLIFEMFLLHFNSDICLTLNFLHLHDLICLLRDIFRLHVLYATL